MQCSLLLPASASSFLWVQKCGLAVPEVGKFVPAGIGEWRRWWEDVLQVGRNVLGLGERGPWGRTGKGWDEWTTAVQAHLNPSEAQPVLCGHLNLHRIAGAYLSNPIMLAGVQYRIQGIKSYWIAPKPKPTLCWKCKSFGLAVPAQGRIVPLDCNQHLPVSKLNWTHLELLECRHAKEKLENLFWTIK